MDDGFTNQLAALLNKSGKNLEMNKQIPLEIGRYHCLFYKYAERLVLSGVSLDVREGDKYIGKPSIKEYFKYSTALLNQKNGKEQNNIGA